MLPDHYATLGIAPHSNPAAVRGAYLQLMRRYHPDRNSSAAAEARVRAITLAYAVLRVAERREAYDAQRTRWLAAQRLANMPQRQQWRLGPMLGIFSGIGVFMLLLPLLISPAVIQPDGHAPPSNIAERQQTLPIQQDNTTRRHSEAVEAASGGATIVRLSRERAVARPITVPAPMPGAAADQAEGAAAPEQAARLRAQAKLARQAAPSAQLPPARLVRAHKTELIAEPTKPLATASARTTRTAAQAVQALPLQPPQPAWLRPLQPTQPAWLRPLPPIQPEIAADSARAIDGQ